MIISGNPNYEFLARLHKFAFFAKGHMIVIYAKSKATNTTYSFAATPEIIETILFTLNKKIYFGTLSKLQYSSIISFLKLMDSKLELFSINDIEVVQSKTTGSKAQNNESPKTHKKNYHSK